MNLIIANPKSKLDTAAVFLVILQWLYCAWELVTLHPKGLPWQFMLPAVATYSLIVFALPGYFRGKQWAWDLIFLFSVYVLHQAIIMKLYWHGGIEQSFAVVEIVASLLCLRILCSAAKLHSICRKEISKVLGAIAVTLAVIFVRGEYFPPIPDVIVSSFSLSWVSVETMSQITAWRMLLLLYCGYAGIFMITFITARFIPTRSAQAHR